ncbi:hypothetical protein [Candidatus Williamhamiltonella defendens]|uniref:hypothetical protein n=1 Tax=Candidatus Williamhamiltonella defendens TaxID=138072 RepID=UPI00130D4C14|nr:hypothetical protein [Candidatus Hamiltonella defensa]
MWLICFTQKYSDIDPDSLNNHALIIYSSNQELLKKIENECDIGADNAHNNSYSHFIDMCTENIKKRRAFAY